MLNVVMYRSKNLIFMNFVICPTYVIIIVTVIFYEFCNMSYVIIIVTVISYAFCNMSPIEVKLITA